MTRKDYIAIADALRRAFNIAEVNGEPLTFNQKQSVIGHIALTMKRDNANFDSKKFADAANPMFQEI